MSALLCVFLGRENERFMAGTTNNKQQVSHNTAIFRDAQSEAPGETRRKNQRRLII